MNWNDIASLVFICVTANHLGLVKAIEETFERELPIINCVKCFSFWSVLIYSMLCTRNIIMSLVISFIASYSALWLELFEAFIDSIYLKLYGKISKTDSDDTSASYTSGDYSASSVSEL